MKKRVLVVAAVALAHAAIIQGCTFDDTTEPAHPYGGNDSGTDATVGDGASPDAMSITGLCAKVGGASVVTSIANDTNAKLAADCRIGGYFATMPADAMTHMNECFAIYLGATFDCDGVKYIGAKDSKGADCKSMANAHQGLGISNDDFTAFREDIVAVMKAKGMAQADINSVMSLLTGVTGVYNGNKRGNYECTCAGNMGCAAVPEGGMDAEAGRDGGMMDAPMDSPPADTGGGMDAGADGD